MDGSIHVYCINLKHRADRWKRFSEQPEVETIMKNHSFERFEGINGSALDIKNDSRISLRTKRNIREHQRRDHEELDSAGGVGCYLSHTGVWKKFLERSEPYAIVFEDDATIPVGFMSQLYRGMREATLLPQTPDLWFFTGPLDWYYDYKGKENPSAHPTGPWITNTCATFTGYLISRKGAERLLETAFPIDMHIDMYSCLAGDLGRIYTVYNTNVTVKPFALKGRDTDIQVQSGCLICDVPTNYQNKGIVVVNVPILIVAMGALMGMYFLGIKKGRL
jgi:GR25 family glycosyltransferase involved in LPS biosynthesis